MIPKIKMLVKKAKEIAKGILTSTAQWIRSEKPKKCVQTVCEFLKNLWQLSVQVAKKAWQWTVQFSIKACQLAKKLWQLSVQVVKKVWQWAVHTSKKIFRFVKNLWMSSENRILLILIGAVLILLILALILIFGMDWSNTVGICYRGDTNATNAAYRQTLEQTLTQRGFEVIVTDSDGDQSRQLEQIEKLKQRHCKVLIVEPVSDGDALMQALNKSGLATVLIGAMPENVDISSYRRIACVQWNVAEAGTVQGQMVAELPDGGDINGDGEVSYFVLQGPEENEDGLWMAEKFQNFLTERQTKAQRLLSDYGEATVEGGLELCKNALATYGKDIEVILCCSPQLTAGAVQAVEDSGRKVNQDVYLYGVGTESALLQMLEEGRLSGTVDIQIQQGVEAVTDAVIAFIGGLTANGENQIEYTAITAGNK